MSIYKQKKYRINKLMEESKITSLIENSEKDNRVDSLKSSLSTDSDSSSSSQINNNQNHEKDFSKEKSLINCIYIKEVYNYNLEEAFHEIKSIINEGYNYIGMDTEFPGVVYNIENLTKNFYYDSLKTNVNSLKLIQLGITFTNSKGEFPSKSKYHTFQFNFQFDQEKDKFSQESINLLKNNGINFSLLKKNGIFVSKFSESLMKSGLVLNPNMKWISYHGAYDFAYLLRLLLNDNIPEKENEFMNLLSMYFPTFYDVRIMIRENDLLFHGGLNKLISELNIERKGINHQAGSDSIATIESFHELIKKEIIDEIKIKKLRNVLYGLGIGEDDENTIKYINININNNNYKKDNLEENKANNEKKNIKNINNNLNKVNQKQNMTTFNNNLAMNINYMRYFQQIQNQQRINNIILCKNVNNCIPYLVYNNSYQMMMRNNILMNNMKLAKVNA